MNRWTQLPKQLHAIVARTPGSILLQTSRFDELNQRSLFFTDPVRTISIQQLDEVPELFRQIEEGLAHGFHVAGYLGYECGYHFERFSDVAITANDLPLAWFGVYRAPIVYDHTSGRFTEAIALPNAKVSSDILPDRLTEKAELEIAKEDYCEKIERIKEYIAAGETYQVNFTDRVHITTPIAADIAFELLLEQQPVPYSAFLNINGHHILSLSPELFFRIEDGKITTRPMKGTMPRGLDIDEDNEAAQRLQRDEKNRSEHVMIVDLLRNDLGRICTMGSVQVEDLFSVEKYATLLQMTSTVSGTLQRNLSFYEIFKGIFPSGSITGAPKIRTMQIIHELEQKPRGTYTGAIGHIAPDRSATFNVAIRTVVLKDGEAYMGVGGGIVADSKPLDEYRECLLKAEFLARPRRSFQLIETMLWNGEFSRISMHMERLQFSADYFGFTYDRAAIEARLIEEAAQLQPGQRYRIRLLLDATGAVTITSAQLTSEQTTTRVRLATQHTSSQDVFYRHKTTHRALYQSQYAAALAEGFDEVIFTNERGEITEGAISNVFIQRDGKLLTPPLSSGVLPGIYRRHLLETDPNAEECILSLHDLESAEAVFLCNSVRGMNQVKLTRPDRLPL